MFWGLLFIAIGVGALLDITIWPLVLIAIGVATLLPALAGKNGKRGRYGMWWCSWGPSGWDRSSEPRDTEPGESQRPLRD